MKADLLENLKNNKKELEVKLSNVFQKHMPDIEAEHNKTKKKIKKEWYIAFIVCLIIAHAIFLPMFYYSNARFFEMGIMSFIILLATVISTYLCFLGNGEELIILQKNLVRERFESIKKSETLNKEELVLFLRPIEECFGSNLPEVIAEVMRETESKEEIGSYYVMLNLYDRAIEKEENSEDIGIYQKQVKGLLGK